MRDKPPYYVVRRGRAFFQLGRERAQRVDMAPSIPLGEDGKKSRAEAWKLYHAWLSNCGRKPEQPEARKYSPGTFGSWFDHYRNTRSWVRKAATTRREWFDSWKYIEPYLANFKIRRITPNDIETMHEDLERDHGETIRWRAIKITRALFNAAKAHQVIDSVPTLTLPNTPPRGRTAIWFADEVATLIETAEKIERVAMQIAIRVGWETLFQPVDVRTLTLDNRHRDNIGAYFHRERSKTKAEAFGYISDETDALIDAYVASLPITIMPDQPFLRTSRDAHVYTKARFIDDFRIVRKEAFGEDETRRFQDIRRSGNVEADLAGASPEDRAEILANLLHEDKFLEDTYTPPTVAKARKIAQMRINGRDALAAVRDAGTNSVTESKN